MGYGKGFSDKIDVIKLQCWKKFTSNNEKLKSNHDVEPPAFTFWLTGLLFLISWVKHRQKSITRHPATHEGHTPLILHGVQSNALTVSFKTFFHVNWKFFTPPVQVTLKKKINLLLQLNSQLTNYLYHVFEKMWKGQNRLANYHPFTSAIIWEHYQDHRNEYQEKITNLKYI